MDIINLYQSKKPYNPRLQRIIDEGHQQLKQSRLPVLGVSCVIGLIFALTSRFRTYKQIAWKSSIIIGGGIALNQAYQWNKLLAKMYIVHKSIEQM